MGRNLKSYTSGGEQSLVARGGPIGCRDGQFGKRTRAAPQVAWRRIENGIFLGEPGRPTGQIVEVALFRLGRLKDRLGEFGGGWRVFRGRGDGVGITKAKDKY
jgi:hypothetical protein